jgi:hypothetical protein
LKRIACQIAAVVVMSTMLAAGTVCIVPAASHPAMAGCHHERIPRREQPADYRCCVSRYRPALLTNVSLPHPAQRALAVIVALVFAPVSDTESCSRNATAASPPGVLALRI